MERRATTPTAHASSVNRKKRNRRKESCNGTDYIDWRSAHRKIACRHYVGSLKRRVELQNSGKYDKIFIMIADAQALTDNAEHPEKVRQNIIEVALDYLACGLDPVKSTMFIQSQIPELCELSFYYMNLVTVARLQRNPTVKSRNPDAQL